MVLFFFHSFARSLAWFSSFIFQLFASTAALPHFDVFLLCHVRFHWLFFSALAFFLFVFPFLSFLPNFYHSFLSLTPPSLAGPLVSARNYILFSFKLRFFSAVAARGGRSGKWTEKEEFFFLRLSNGIAGVVVVMAGRQTPSEEEREWRENGKYYLFTISKRTRKQAQTVVSKAREEEEKNVKKSWRIGKW